MCIYLYWVKNICGFGLGTSKEWYGWTEENFISKTIQVFIIYKWYKCSFKHHVLVMNDQYVMTKISECTNKSLQNELL